MEFTGKNCFVTGGSAGIGKACVELFASKGAKVFTFARHEENSKELVESLVKKGFDVQGCICDITDEEALKKTLEQAKEVFGGKLHVLVNNVGTCVVKPFMEQTRDIFDQLVNTNVKSMVNVSQAVHPLLKEAGGASVVNLGSICGSYRTSAEMAVYNLTKSAIESLTRTLACEWASDNIRVNCIAPGIIRTASTAAVADDPALVNRWTAETMIKRLGEAEEVANVAAFFASTASSYVTGQTLYVDGGYTVRGMGF